MRLIALDVGDKRIGVAMCDPDRILASPLTTLIRQMIRESGGRPSENKGKIDSVAAAIILQAYLDSRK